MRKNRSKTIDFTDLPTGLHIRCGAPDGKEGLAPARLIDLFFTQSLGGVFFMMLDEPVEWNDGIDKEEVIDHCFSHQRITRANQAILDQYRAGENEFLGLTPYDFYKHDIEQGRRVWRYLLDRGAARVETEEIRLDGKTIWVEGDYICLYDAEGRFVGHFGIQNDVTKRKEYEAEINRSRQRLESIVKTQREMVCRFRPDTTLTFVNAAYCRLFGKEAEELIGKPFLNLVPKGEHAAIRASLAALGPARPTQTNVHQSITGDGSIVWQEWTDHVVFDENNKVREIQSTGRDITKQKEFEDKLRRANKELRTATAEAKQLAVQAEEASRAKSAFLATMSHEIRTPLTAIIGMGSLLLETGLDRQQQTFAQTIVKSGETLLRVINDILDYSKIEAGKLTLDAVSFRTMEWVNHSLGMILAMTRKSGVELTYYVDPATPAEFVGDRTRLEQVLTNLLSNAARFTESGEIHLSLGAVPRADSPFWDLHAVVQDTGVGIDPETQSRLFKPFTQGHDGTKHAPGGTGLGLAICKHILGHMGGSIGVDSEPGKGSTFHFTVPLEVKRPDYLVYMRKESACYRNRRLLIVDDNPNNCRLLKALAHALGMQAEAFTDPNDALRASSEGRTHDIAIVDQAMPGVDGVSLARGLREQGATYPFILLTAVVSDFEKDANAGLFSAIRGKPIHTGELSQTIREILQTENQPAGRG